MAKIFVLDDEKDLLISLKAWAKKSDHTITTFENSEGFLDALLKKKPDVILVDINLKSDDGRYITEDLKNILPFPVKIILISGDAGALLNYHERYADGVLNKPFTFLELEKKLLQHLKK